MTPRDPRQLLLRSGRLIDGRGVVREVADLLVADGRIARIDPVIDLAGVETWDVAGRTVCPGLVNAHVHVCLDASADPERSLRAETAPETTIRAAARLRETVRMGVTTVRDLGGVHGIAVALARLVESGEIEGPRILAAGRVVTMTGGHGHWMGVEADGPDAVRRAVRGEMRDGATTIKVMATGGMMTQNQVAGAPQLTVDEMRAAVDEAHKAGLIVAAHAESRVGAMNAVLAGVDSIEHGHGIDREVIDLMVERDVALVPTIQSDRAILEGGVDAGIPAFVVEACRRLADGLVVALELAIRSSVRIVAGNDGGAPLVHPGDIATELELYVEHGMTPQDALATATSAAADLFGWADVGRIEVGCAADLLVLDGDPLATPSALRHPQAVIARGQVVKAGPATVEARA